MTCGIVYGPIGIGKTTEIARAFPDWAWILTNRSSIRRAVSEGMKPRVIKVLSEYEQGQDVDGLPVRSKTIQVARSILMKIEKAKVAGKFDAPGIVISEGTALIRWIYEDARASIGRVDRRTGLVKLEGRARFDMSEIALTFVRWLADFASRNDLGVILDCHRRERVFHEEGAKIGEVKWPAGPDMPEGRMVEEISRPLDFVWEMAGEESDAGSPFGRTVFLTRPGQDVIRKTRGKGVDAVEPISESDGLREKLIRAKLLDAR